MRVELLHYFVQIVESRSFSKAAQKLFLTQPALTNAMNTLEEELGLRLLVRSNRGVTPTAHGSVVYEDCRRILGELNVRLEAWKALAAPEKDRAELVPLVGIPTACNYIADEILPLLRARWKGLSLSLHEASPGAMYDVLRQGRARIGVTAFRLEEAEEWTHRYRTIHFRAAPLLDDEYVVFLSARHPLAEKEALSAVDCAALPFATYSLNRDGEDAIFRTAAELFRVQEIYYLNSRESIMQMIAQNKAAGFFLRRMTRNNWYVKNGLVRAMAVEGARLLPSRHYVLWLEEEALSGAEKKVLAFLRDHYAPDGPADEV